MGERTLSNREIEAMVADDQNTVRFFRACIRRNKMHPVEERTGDRRKAISTYIDPAMDRRSGYDRRHR